MNYFFLKVKSLVFNKNHPVHTITEFHEMSAKQFKNKRKLDKFYCKSVAKSISEVIRFSLNEDFRKKSFELFRAFSTKGTEKKIKRKLKKLVKNEGTDKRSVSTATQQNVKQSRISEGDKENSQHKNDSEDKQISLCLQNTGGLNSDELIMSNIYKRNWLQISSAQYKETIRKLQYKNFNCYSQPDLIRSTEFGFHSSNVHSDDSVMTSSEVSSASQDSANSLSYHSTDDNENYYKAKFKELFQDNVKYLKKNIKTNGNLSF